MKKLISLISLLVISTSLALAQTNTFEVTAYCACVKCCGKWSGGPTASGKMPVQGITAAASRAIPFDTILKIEGVGTRVVQDRLAKKYDHRIDIYFTNHTEALKFGKHKLKVTLLKPTPPLPPMPPLPRGVGNVTKK